MQCAGVGGVVHMVTDAHGPVVPPVLVPKSVMRSTGVNYCHVSVRTSRLVLQAMQGVGGGVYRVLGTIDGGLCTVPVRMSIVHGFQGSVPAPAPASQRGGSVFRDMCRSVAAAVLPRPMYEDALGDWTGRGWAKSTLGHTRAYRDQQWFAALLDEGATIERGGCTLLSPARCCTRDGVLSSKIASRRVEDSLVAEMHRMGCLFPQETSQQGSHPPRIDPLPPHTNDQNRSIVTLRGVVGMLGVCYEEREESATTSASTFDFKSVQQIPGQSLDVHRIVSVDSNGLSHIRDGYRRLWTRSFECHACYGIDRDCSTIVRIGG